MSLSIGLTGGIASGKSTVMNYFEALGIECIDADAIVSDLLDNDTSVQKAIKSQFGEDYLNIDGKPDRKKIRARIFSTQADRIFLEQLIHPLVRDRIQRAISAVITPYAIIAVPLLIESGMTDLVDRILIVDIPSELQRIRLIERDHISAERADSMIAAQISREERLNYADDVIDNTDNIENLRENVCQLHQRYLQLAECS
jgi:dephospho-CoA kinase